MSVVREPNRLEQLEADIDCELFDLYREALEEGVNPLLEDDGMRAVFVAFMRAAWGHGYCLGVKDKGKFGKEHGYTI